MPSPQIQERPDRATREYVLWLLREHCLASDAPLPLAEPLLEILLDLGVLSRPGDDQYELPSAPGGLLEYQPWKRLMKALEKRPEGFEFLDSLFRGSGATGGGAGMPLRDLRSQPRLSPRKKEELAKLRWDTPDLLSKFSSECRDAARTLIDHVLNRKQASPPDTRTIRRDVPAAPTPPIITYKFVAPEKGEPHVELVHPHGPNGEPIRAQVRGRTRARLLKSILDQPQQDHRWTNLLRNGVETGFWTITDWRSLERQGRSIRLDLPPELRCYWEMNGRGVRWETPTKEAT